MTTLRRTIDDTARRAIAARTEALFRASGALREGHFVLKSGRHSDAYLEKFQVLQDPAATSELCGFWAAAHRDDDGASTVDLVAGPTTGGVILAFETGRQLGTRAIFAEEVASDRRRAAARVPARVHDRGRGARAARRRHPHDRRLAAGDAPGGRGRGRRGRRVRGPGRPVRRPVDADVACDRPRLPLRALWQLELPTYEPGAATCPRCAAGEPAVKPGSSGTGLGPA